MRFDFHLHSKYSKDCFLEPRKILKLAKKKGLSGIAVTDHDTIRGGLVTKNYADKNFFVLVGSEIKTDIGDFIGLFLNEEIKSRKIFDVIDEINAQDGLAVLPHPFRAHKWDLIDNRLIERIDLIEIFNSRCSISQNARAARFARAQNLSVIAGSDAHFSPEIGRGVTIIENVSTEEDIRKSLIKGAVKISGRLSLPYFRLMSKFAQWIKKK